ncbi:glycosyltransferase family 4 protein [Seonamhaeicola sp.]|uniref:glycosyltransferase family 4 protein n=1 Tax=Seonamhaeicola sp. TaxID=1912245 RepID=UPI00261E905A|nr:glycosyltransferase family 4 protein [Seonamhaeicola sp.]
MKVIYITEQVYLYGGAEKILIQKLNYWADIYGYDVLLITSEQRNREVCYPLSKKVSHIDLDVGYKEDVSYFKWVNLTKFPKHYKALKKAIKEFNPDAIFLISLSWIRLVLPFLTKKPTYNEYHTSYYGFHLKLQSKSFVGKLKKKLWDLVINVVENYYTNIVFLNSEELNFYKRKNGVIIPNFFERVDFIEKTEKKKQIISLGRMSYQKGYDLLIKAWAKIDNKIEGWTLQVYGDGENKEALLKELNSYNFKNKMYLNDAIPDVNIKLAESEFYVMSSRFETFPMVLLEALSHGLPIVSFDCPTGPRSIMIENEDGILAKPDDVEDLAKKMLLLITDEELRGSMSKKAIVNINRFKPEYVMDLWDKLIKKNSKVTQ